MALPKYPLPTHDVVVRGGVPNAFSQSVVAYDETQKPSLKKALLLGDAISDLPRVENHQPHEVMEYGAPPKREFQRYIRLSRKDMLDYSFGGEAGPDEGKLLDHQPLRLNNDDHQRVQQIPIKKGANFRDLRGVKVGANNIVEWDPEIERVYLPSGKPLVPDYAMSFIKGRSLKPFGRLWWDETVPTVVTRAEPHNQIILHPDQARVLTVRENARLQGFPDYYRLFGPIKEKYIQVGNAVAVPVARALGYCLGQAYLGESDGSDPLSMLPDSFTAIGQAAARASSVSIPAGEVLEQ
ncbi:hypothetical protein PR202_ga08032 [Eleusine coracana subsp. coracana]|uniref:DNA (cytosine-5-)-methyltransferase n=1 Tax=Eleusine coracana subsp. coracana TaxID=191504 RepID=A0AAV5BZ04_ELECO|nr:hypothetical protein PR202_ga08032 [Eleusine coracana subsp. coracana]